MKLKVFSVALNMLAAVFTAYGAFDMLGKQDMAFALILSVLCILNLLFGIGTYLSIEEKTNAGYMVKW